MVGAGGVWRARVGYVGFESGEGGPMILPSKMAGKGCCVGNQAKVIEGWFICLRKMHLWPSIGKQTLFIQLNAVYLILS